MRPPPRPVAVDGRTQPAPAMARPTAPAASAVREPADLAVHQGNVNLGRGGRTVHVSVADTDRRPGSSWTRRPAPRPTERAGRLTGSRHRRSDRSGRRSTFDTPPHRSGRSSPGAAGPAASRHRPCGPPGRAARRRPPPWPGGRRSGWARRRRAATVGLGVAAGEGWRRRQARSGRTLRGESWASRAAVVPRRRTRRAAPPQRARPHRGPQDRRR